MAQDNGKQLAYIPLNRIRENPVALRGVDRKTDAYSQLVDSIRQHGVFNPIVVREYGKDDETGEVLYAVIDGLQRYSASLDAGKKDIPAHIKNMEDARVWEAQIIGNAQKIETRPHEYAKQIQLIFTQNPTLTASELAARLNKSPEWISKMLGLIRIKDTKIQELINESKITLSNAYSLSKLPEEEQVNWVDRAMTQSPAEFIPAADARAKEIKDAKRKGKNVGPEVYAPHATLRKMKELKEEKDNFKTGAALIKQLNVTTVEAAWKLCLDWVLSLDPPTLEVRKRKEEEKKEKAKQENEKLKAEKAEARAREAAQKVAEIKAGK